MRRGTKPVRVSNASAIRRPTDERIRSRGRRYISAINAFAVSILEYMLCEQCATRPATVHLLQTATGGRKAYHLCEPCAKRRSYKGQPLLVSQSTLEEQGWLSVSGRVIEVESSAITLLVERSSMFPPGYRLSIRASFVPEEQRVIGATFGFSCPPEAMRIIGLK